MNAENRILTVTFKKGDVIEIVGGKEENMTVTSLDEFHLYLTKKDIQGLEVNVKLNVENEVENHNGLWIDIMDDPLDGFMDAAKDLWPKVQETGGKITVQAGDNMKPELAIPLTCSADNQEQIRIAKGLGNSVKKGPLAPLIPSPGPTPTKPPEPPGPPTQDSMTACPQDEGGKGGLNDGAIAGIVIAVLFVVAVVSVLVYLLVIRPRRRGDLDYTGDGGMEYRRSSLPDDPIP
jgi:hypothetical protein